MAHEAVRKRVYGTARRYAKRYTKRYMRGPTKRPTKRCTKPYTKRYAETEHKNCERNGHGLAQQTAGQDTKEDNILQKR